MAPSRPAVYPEQWGLLLLTILAMAAGIYAVARFAL
jgi:F0F1-type ATP synthase assembly protein I